MKMLEFPSDWTDEMTPAAPIFTARDGLVFRRGFYTDAETCIRLLELWRTEARDGSDYFAKNARDLASELEQAMREAGIIQQKEAA